MKTAKIKLPKIKVKNSGILPLQFYNDFPDGNLVIIEAKKNTPFNIKRVYFINNLFNKKSKRGKHAHKKLKQAIFCINGSFSLTINDGTTKQKIKMDNPYYGVIIAPLLWHEMHDFSSDCVILVIADDYYKESDYIRNYNEFLKFINKKK